MMNDNAIMHVTRRRFLLDAAALTGSAGLGLVLVRPATATPETMRAAIGKVIGDAPGKGAIVAFNLAGIHPHDVSTVIDREGIAVRAGTHCAQPLLDRFGVTATCRASFGLYNTRADVDRLADALEKARRLFA